MKCECIHCEGTGQVRCSDCGGSGEREVDIEDMDLDKHHEKYDELVALKEDAARARRDASTLTRMNPTREDSYQRQLSAVLKQINKQADELQKV